MSVEVIPGRKKWTQPQRLSGLGIFAGDQDLGRATIDIRTQVKEGDLIRETIDGQTVSQIQNPDKAVAWEIRVRVAKKVRDELGGTTSSLTFRTSSRSDGQGGYPTQRWTFRRVDWRRSCCRLLGYADGDWEMVGETEPVE